MKAGRYHCKDIDKLKESLFDLIERQIKTNKEQYVKLCINKKTEEPRISNICTGEKHSVHNFKESKCNNDEYYFGSFHTHPPHTRPMDILSENDVLSSIQQRDNLACIGTRKNKKDVIKCFEYSFGFHPSELEHYILLKKEYYKLLQNYDNKLKKYSNYDTETTYFTWKEETTEQQKAELHNIRSVIQSILPKLRMPYSESINPVCLLEKEIS